MSNEDRHLVFVYGTLKNGEPNNYWFYEEGKGTATFLGRGKTVRKFPLVIGNTHCNRLSV